MNNNLKLELSIQSGLFLGSPIQASEASSVLKDCEVVLAYPPRMYYPGTDEKAYLAIYSSVDDEFYPLILDIRTAEFINQPSHFCKFTTALEEAK